MTQIEWTDVTWNAVVGCSRVSAGCVNCFAERFVHRGLAPQHRGLTVMRGGRPGWTGEVRLVESRLAEPLSWKKPRRVFVNSLPDLFHEGLRFEDIAAIFGVMAACSRHTFQVLTKRPERAREFFAWLDERGNDPVRECSDAMEVRRVQWTWPELWPDWPLPNVWIGTSVEDQATADERIPRLLACPASVRFVSYEPALGPVVFQQLWLTPHTAGGDDGIGWIIVGGESGPGARPFDLAWARSVVAQCREAGVACFVKQLGAQPVDGTRSAIHDVHGVAAPSLDHDEAKRIVAGYRGGHVVRPAPVRLRDRKGGNVREWPADLRVREFPNPKDTTR